MTMVFLGIDLAKNVLALHGVDAAGRACLVARACGAISCWRWSPNCRPTPSAWKRVRARTTGRASSPVRRLDERVAEYDEHICMMAQADDRSEALMQVPGIGATTASALLASIGHGHDFANGRQFAAWLGLVPGQYSSGGKQRLGRITKAGDSYLRTLLILGARAMLAAATKKKGSPQPLALMSDCTFLSFMIKGKKIRWADSALLDVKHRVRKLTGCSWGVSMDYRLKKLAQYLRGWFGYFGISQYYRPIPELDEWIRRRVRMCYWKQCRWARTKIRHMVNLGVALKAAIQDGVSSLSYWRMARPPVTQQAMSNAWLKEQGLLSVKDLWCKTQGHSA